MRKIIIDLDDFQPSAVNLDLLLKLKEHFPKLKISAFTIPIDANLIFGKIKKEKVLEWAGLMRKLDWVEFYPHGIAHTPNEWQVNDKKKVEAMIKVMEKAFNDLDLPFKKVFKAPFWQLSKEAGEVLREHGYIIAEDRNQPRMFKDSYVYNWSLEEDFPKDEVLVKGHGHLDGESENALDKVFLDLLYKLPNDAEFKFISEVI